MDKFQHKFRIDTARAPFWNYGWNGAYFITICTRDRAHYFGEIVEGKMDLSPIGHFANSCWFEIPNHFPFVVLAAHVIMPNHVHGIIIINKPNDENPNAGRSVETQNFASPPSSPPSSPSPSQSHNKFGPQSLNLASVIRGFKTGVTKNARIINSDFSWQPRYHDHIIRHEKSYQKISEYIINNPLQWADDKFYRSGPRIQNRGNI